MQVTLYRPRSKLYLGEYGEGGREGRREERREEGRDRCREEERDRKREMDGQAETKSGRERQTQKQRGCRIKSNVERDHRLDREQGTIDGGCGREK